jgi:hypothetical protein
MIDLKEDVKLNTDGSGLWSGRAAAVDVIRLLVPYVNEEETFGELRVYFDEDSWNVREHGLIYTDRVFAEELRQLLESVYFSPEAADDMEYSEQGIQGDNFVSLDAGKHFLTEWLEIPGNNDHL